MSPQDRLAVGQTFQSWEELKDAIVDYGVASERIIVSYKKDTSRFIGKCKMNKANSSSCSDNCPMFVRAVLLQKTETITIVKSILQHSCEASSHYVRRMHSSFDRLADRILEIIVKNRPAQPRDLLNTAQALVHPDIEYHTAWLAKRVAIRRLDGKESDSFQLIPAHCHHILERDPGATAKWSAPGGRFESLFVCPSASRKAFKDCRPLIAFDGTHTRSMYPQILLIATAIDPNNQIYFLAYYMCPVENSDHWLNFCRLIADAISEIEQPMMVFISDRQKGLLPVVEKAFPRGWHAFCAWHLGDNVRCKFGKAWEKAFVPLVYAASKEKYNNILEEIGKKNKDVFDYIRDTAAPEHYARAFLPVKRWGHETSQQAESLNRAIKPQRMEVAFRQSNLLWDYMMRMVWEKHEVAISCNTPFPSRIMDVLKKVEEGAYYLTADVSSEREVRISDGVHGDFLVQFEPDWFCSCGDWQDIQLPCTHAWRAMTKLKLRHHDYVSPVYATHCFRRVYSHPIPAILSSGLVPNAFCGEPLNKRRAGRPSDKQRTRFEPEDECRNKRRCKHCRSQDHDIRGCALQKALLAQARGRHDAEEGLISEPLSSTPHEEVINIAESQASSSQAIISQPRSTLQQEGLGFAESQASSLQAIISQPHISQAAYEAITDGTSSGEFRELMARMIRKA